MRNPKIGDRVVTNNLDWGVIESVDHVQPELTNAGYDGKQTFPETPWFRVRLDKGGIELQDASRMSRTHPFGDPGRVRSPVNRDHRSSTEDS